jgi:hypothetical protein
VEWVILDQRMVGVAAEQLSILNDMLSIDNPLSAKEQLNIGYSQYGGWRPMQGFTLDDNHRLCYPGDPPQKPWAVTKLRDEMIFVYHSDWVLILQWNNTFEVCRMD